MKKLLLPALFAALAIASVYYFSTKKECTEGPCSGKPVLLVGTADDFPPFCFNDNGEIVGFDIDVISAVAQKLEKKLVLKNIEFDVLLLELQSGALDAIAAGLTATEERAKRVLFTEPYLTGDVVVMLQLKGDHITPLTSPEEMKNKRVVVNTGYISDLYVTKMGINPLRVITVSEAMLALTSGQADVFVSAQTPLNPFFAQQSSANFIITPIAGQEENCSLAVTKKRPELFQQIETALQELKQDGTIETLKKKWNL